MEKLTLPIALLFVFAFNTASAQSLPDSIIKTDIQPIEAPLKRLMNLQPKTFSYNTQQFRHLSLPGGQHHGFLASEVQNVFPGLVSQRQVRYSFGKNLFKDAYIPQVDEKALVPILVAAVKELNGEVERLKAELQAIKSSSR